MSGTMSEILSRFKRDIKNSFQAQKNIVDVTEKYIGLLENAEGGSGGGGIDYSETEQDTGLKWIDGKAIYQKTIIIRKNSVDKFSKSSYSYVNCLPSNYEFIMLKGMYAKRGNWIDCFNMKSELATCFDIENNGFYFQATANYSDIIITIQYTKST